MTVTIIGTSHIAAQSIAEIKNQINTQKPDFIGLELDAQRADALLHGEKKPISLATIMTIGVKGYLFAKIGQLVQRHLGSTVGIEPGAEMKTALELAREQKIPVAYIDQPIAITLRNFSKQITWKERFRFCADLLYGLLFPRKMMREYGFSSFDLRTVPSAKLIETMMTPLRQRYPSVYKTIVEDRNTYMVRKIIHLLRAHPEKHLLVIVGAGHKKGMEELLLKVDVL